ncbi:MAG: class I SAM-dependent methyltransferase, partial [Acidimicrobiia bacterium]
AWTSVLRRLLPAYWAIKPTLDHMNRPRRRRRSIEGRSATGIERQGTSPPDEDSRSTGRGSTVASDSSDLTRYQAPDDDSLLAQLEALRLLKTTGVGVPSIVEVDFDGRSMTLVEATGRRLWETEATLDPKLLDRLWVDLRQIHRARLILGQIDAETILIGPDGAPHWCDFGNSRDCSKLSTAAFRLLADMDTDSFNRLFGTDHPTYETIRRSLETKSDPVVRNWYAPAYLGAGLRTGPIWNLGVGWGRWEYLLRSALPPVSGMRVLDIGSNNGHNALQMLRAGAKEVVGLERSEHRIQQGRFLKEAFEWSDNTSYAYQSIRSDMRELPHLALGAFDMVTAFCSLYYLSENEMVDLIRHLSEMTPILVLQCNEQTDIGRKDPDTYRRASLPFTRSILEENGFRDLRTVAPRDYRRPLVIGYRR